MNRQEHLVIYVFSKYFEGTNLQTAIDFWNPWQFSPLKNLLYSTKNPTPRMYGYNEQTEILQNLSEIHGEINKNPKISKCVYNFGVDDLLQKAQTLHENKTHKR